MCLVPAACRLFQHLACSDTVLVDKEPTHQCLVCHALSSAKLRAVTAARFTTAAGKCPRPGTLVLSTGSAPGTDGLTVPSATRVFYPNLVSPFKIFLGFPTIAPGSSYCVKAGSKKITIGGTLLFKTDVAGTTCVKPPTKADGSPCCVLKSWQPNNEGLYLPDCSMRRALSTRPVA